MKYIEALREGERIQEIYLCKQKNVAMTKTGKEYENVILQDKTGSLDAKIWDPRSMGIDDFDALDYVEVSGDVTVFNGQTQLSIKRARKVKEGEYDPSDYLPVSDKNLDDMFNELLGFISKVENTYYKQLLSKLFIENQEFAKAFKNHSAAKSVHHGFIGGLLEHTVSVTRLCEFYTKQYPMLNKDLLITAAICHDIGKVYELSSFPLNDYTDVGQLLGHIVMGSEMVGDIARTISGFPKTQLVELKHCILAHHGELEYGSPREMRMEESFILNSADSIDATMNKISQMKEKTEAGNWSEYDRRIETRLYL